MADAESSTKAQSDPQALAAAASKQSKGEGKEDQEAKEERKDELPSTPAASSSAPESHTTILDYARFIVRNLIPASSELFKPDSPAVMLSDVITPPAFPMYWRPFQLVWLFDSDAANKRAELADTPSYLRHMPSLPYWMVASDGRNECMPRSFMLADVGASLDVASGADEWKKAMFEMRRSRVTGSALDKDKEALILEGYRKRSAPPMLRVGAGCNICWLTCCLFVCLFVCLYLLAWRNVPRRCWMAQKLPRTSALTSRRFASHAPR